MPSRKIPGAQKKFSLEPMKMSGFQFATAWAKLMVPPNLPACQSGKSFSVIKVPGPTTNGSSGRRCSMGGSLPAFTRSASMGASLYLLAAAGAGALVGSGALVAAAAGALVGSGALVAAGAGAFVGSGALVGAGVGCAHDVSTRASTTRNGHRYLDMAFRSPLGYRTAEGTAFLGG